MLGADPKTHKAILSLVVDELAANTRLMPNVYQISGPRNKQSQGGKKLFFQQFVGLRRGQMT